MRPVSASQREINPAPCSNVMCKNVALAPVLSADMCGPRAVSAVHSSWKPLKGRLHLTCDDDGNVAVRVQQTVVMSRLTALIVSLHVMNSLASRENVSFSNECFAFRFGTNYKSNSVNTLFSAKHGAVAAQCGPGPPHF